MGDTRKVLVTGANSFIGSFFKQHAENYEVDEACVKENKVSDLNFKPYDTVFHVAAIVHQTSKLSDEFYFQVNSDLALEVAQKAKEEGVRQFVFMSTVKVYGENSTLENPWDEDTRCHPSDAYGRSKYDAECRLQALQGDGFDVSIIRTPVVYGAEVKGNIKKMAQYIKATRIIPLKGINNVRAMVYIGNLMAMIYRVIDIRKAGVFLASDRRALSTSDFADLMIKATGNKKLFIPIPSFVQHFTKVFFPKSYHRLFGSMVICNDKTIKELDFSPPFSVDQGIYEVMDDVSSYHLKSKFFSL